MIKSILQGRMLEYPLHTALVHFPVGLLVLSLILDLVNALLGENVLVRGAYYTLLGGTGLALVVAIPGLVDYLDIRADHPAKKVATLHLLLNLAAVAVFGISLVLRSNANGLQSTTTTVPALVLSLIGVGIIGYSGYLGGRIIYNDGISVGRHRRHMATPEKTICIGADQIGPDGFAVIAPLERLDQGALLRAEVNGHVMAIARLEGSVYAFQEFCTHRFGPLSEGCLEGREVMCPWHGSRFDIQTGKVAQGPAKVDLKTYDAKIENGQIKVRISNR
jgi:nitrite reductase/ring-hydroxylating ferredoxin subunit/uncharacterized membrane protein